MSEWGQEAVVLIMMLRARLAAGEPFSSVLTWLVTARAWSSGKEGAEKYIREIANIDPPHGEHPTVTAALRARMKELGGCQTCGREALPGGTKCTDCWEVEKRLPDYIRRSKTAFDFVMNEMIKAGGELARIRALHQGLDNLVAEFVASHASKRPSTATLLELMQWSGERVRIEEVAQAAAKRS